MAFVRSFIKYEQPRKTQSDGGAGIYCRQCGREITRQVNPQIRSVSKCAICVLKEQGVKNPEDHVLTQYYLSNDPNKLPVPIDADTSLEGGILLLSKDDIVDKLPMTGGLVGTVRSLFKALGFQKAPEEEVQSKEVATKKRTGGLYDDRIR